MPGLDCNLAGIEIRAERLTFQQQNDVIKSYKKGGILMERQYSIAQIREIITPIAIKHGVKSVSLFGSRARRTDKIDSDIDLIIEKGRLVSLYDLSGFRLAAEDAFQLPVDLVTTECSDHEFLDEITREGVLLYREP